MSLKTVGYIHSKETFGTVDGPGVRYVLFLQGCPMRCKYCHNPDTWSLSNGKEMTVEEILSDYDSYRPFLKGGGITLSGGEALLQIDFVIDLFTEAKKNNIHTALDTSGVTFNRNSDYTFEKFKKLISVTDLFLLDIKHIESMGHKELTGFKNENILDFLKFLDENKKDVWIRHVIVPGITYDKNLLIKLGFELAKYHCIKAVDILPYHNMGEVKYKTLGIDYPLSGTPSLGESEAILARKIVLAAIKKKRTEG
ncbi:MAG: pyruvate formate-lyase-activating protein [Tissierellia bacterium]|nr:pyruvate formate-lyase-activating protein [Tissierellia bacterium]